MEPRPEDKYPKTYQLRRTITENEKGSKIKIALEEKAKQAKVGGTWGIHDEKISSFEENFFTSLPKEYQELEPDIRLKRYIEDTLGGERSKRPLFALELGGPGFRLFADFSKGFFTKTAGVALTDYMRKSIPEGSENHVLVTGDILELKGVGNVYDRALTTLGAGKVDLIICRMEGGLNHMDLDLTILDSIIRRWYSILNEGGLIFVQIGSRYNIPKHRFIETWVEEIKHRYGDSIDITLPKAPEEMNLRLHKKEGAPEELPPAKELFNS